ncbi:MAG: PadR family transcriptional regulator [Thermomicrobiales bacterium]
MPETAVEPAVVPRPPRRPGGLDSEKISSYNADMKRKPGSLLPLETSILAAGLAFRQRGQSEFHGFLVAKELQADTGARRLTAHGTLYKALDRLEQAGLVRSHWEDPELAAQEGRPRRRLYEVTLTGEQALADAGHAARLSATRRGTLEGA